MELYDYTGEELGLEVTTDKTMTQEDVPADAKAVGTIFEDADLMEPSELDIPIVSIDGVLYSTKDEGNSEIVITYKSSKMSFTDYATAKVQGDSSQRYPKKNYTIKLFKDADRTVKSKRSFKDWDKARNKFVLKANWIDHSHARNIVCARLWSQAVKSRSDFSTLPTALKSSNLAIDGFPVKVYYNGVYYGLYTWNLPKDAMYGLDSDVDTNCIIQAEGSMDDDAQIFRKPTMNGKWSDELHDEMPTVIADSWTSVLAFVCNSTDADFISGIDSKIDLGSIIDVHIFLRALCAVDMLGKNQTFCTYDAVKWYAGMYDMDATWGMTGLANTDPISWRSYDTVFQTGYNAYWSFHEENLLHARVWGLFHDRVVTRYQELRSGVLSEGNIVGEFDKFMGVIPPYLYAEDYAETTADGAFVTIPGKTDNNIIQIRDFVVDRLAYVDSVILA